MFVAPFAAPFPSPVASSGAATVPWYLAGGVAAANCKAAYQPIGAASLAASYVNLANPGVNDAAPGVAPTWASATGWTFNGTPWTGQYLTTGGLAPANDQQWSVVCRFSDGPTTAQSMCLFGSASSGGVAPYFLIFPYWPALNGLYGNGNYQSGLAPLSAGVVGFAGDKVYLDGVAQSGTIGTAAGTFLSPYIGARHDKGSPASFYWAGKVQALAVYNTPLTAAQMLAIYTAASALTG